MQRTITQMLMFIFIRQTDRKDQNNTNEHTHKNEQKTKLVFF